MKSNNLNLRTIGPRQSCCVFNCKFLQLKRGGLTKSHHHPLLLCLHHALIWIHATGGDPDRLGSSRWHAGGTRGQVPPLRAPWRNAEGLWPPPEVVLIKSIFLIGPWLVSCKNQWGQYYKTRHAFISKLLATKVTGNE